MERECGFQEHNIGQFKDYVGLVLHLQGDSNYDTAVFLFDNTNLLQRNLQFLHGKYAIF